MLKDIGLQNRSDQTDLNTLIRYSIKYGFPHNFNKYLTELNEKLMKRMLLLDEIECGDDKEKRKNRKTEIKFIQKMHNVIDKLLTQL